MASARPPGDVAHISESVDWYTSFTTVRALPVIPHLQGGYDDHANGCGLSSSYVSGRLCAGRAGTDKRKVRWLSPASFRNGQRLRGVLSAARACWTAGASGVVGGLPAVDGVAQRHGRCVHRIAARCVRTTHRQTLVVRSRAKQDAVLVRLPAERVRDGDAGAPDGRRSAGAQS